MNSPIGPLGDYRDTYVAECGEPFRSRREGQIHENTCHLCQAKIYETDEAREARESEMDLVTNEIIHGFMQHGGRKACRYLLGKLLANKDAEIEHTKAQLAKQQAEIATLRADRTDDNAKG